MKSLNYELKNIRGGYDYYYYFNPWTVVGAVGMVNFSFARVNALRSRGNGNDVLVGRLGK